MVSFYSAVDAIRVTAKKLVRSRAAQAIKNRIPEPARKPLAVGLTAPIVTGLAGAVGYGAAEAISPGSLHLYDVSQAAGIGAVYGAETGFVGAVVIGLVSLVTNKEVRNLHRQNPKRYYTTAGVPITVAVTAGVGSGSAIKGVLVGIAVLVLALAVTLRAGRSQAKQLPSPPPTDLQRLRAAADDAQRLVVLDDLLARATTLPLTDAAALACDDALINLGASATPEVAARADRLFLILSNARPADEAEVIDNLRDQAHRRIQLATLRMMGRADGPLTTTLDNARAIHAAAQAVAETPENAGARTRVLESLRAVIALLEPPPIVIHDHLRPHLLDASGAPLPPPPFSPTQVGRGANFVQIIGADGRMAEIRGIPELGSGRWGEKEKQPHGTLFQTACLSAIVGVPALLRDELARGDEWAPHILDSVDEIAAQRPNALLAEEKDALLTGSDLLPALCASLDPKTNRSANKLFLRLSNATPTTADDYANNLDPDNRSTSRSILIATLRVLATEEPTNLAALRRDGLEKIRTAAQAIPANENLETEKGAALAPIAIALASLPPAVTVHPHLAPHLTGLPTPPFAPVSVERNREGKITIFTGTADDGEGRPVGSAEFDASKGEWQLAFAHSNCLGDLGASQDILAVAGLPTALRYIEKKSAGPEHLASLLREIINIALSHPSVLLTEEIRELLTTEDLLPTLTTREGDTREVAQRLDGYLREVLAEREPNPAPGIVGQLKAETDPARQAALMEGLMEDGAAMPDNATIAALLARSQELCLSGATDEVKDAAAELAFYLDGLGKREERV